MRSSPIAQIIILTIGFTSIDVVSFGQMPTQANIRQQSENQNASQQTVEAKTVASALGFLESIGVVTSFPDRGQPLPKTVEMLKYCGFRWVRGGTESLKANGPTTLQTYLDLHREAGVRFSWGLGSGGSDLPKLLETAKELAAADALLAFEGNNEPNNWGVTYQGEKGGWSSSWLAVARLQADLYRAVKSDEKLKKYPVWSTSEAGAEVDNVGLQFLTIPEGVETELPAGTQFADFANVHNYIYHPAAPGLADNKAWNAADPTSACKIDGLYRNHGKTWLRKYRGYSDDELKSLPRVTTETGCKIQGDVTEEIQALNFLSIYLAQFKRGWSHTAAYLLRDRTDERGNQNYGFFQRDYTPRTAAVYLHNLTTILADHDRPATTGQLSYEIADQPETVHDLLLQKSDGSFWLVVWGERVSGEDRVVVELGDTYSDVQIFNPTAGTDSTRVLKDVKTVELVLTNHPLILRISQQ